jgi:muconolactone delta-isomerase
MTTDLSVHVPESIADPDSGEWISRTDTARVVDVYSRIRDYMRQWRQASDWARDAIIDAADSRSEWSFTIDGAKVKVDPPSAADIDWDLDELHKLEQLLPPERYAELVVQVVTEKPQTGKLQALARQSGADSVIWKIIIAAERRKPRARYVKVSR